MSNKSRCTIHVTILIEMDLQTKLVHVCLGVKFTNQKKLLDLRNSCVHLW